MYYDAKYQFAYCAAIYKLAPDNVRFGADCGSDPACYRADVGPLRGRTWILLSHILIDDGVDEGIVLCDQLDKIGARLDAYRTSGARAYLYDLERPATLSRVP